MTISVITVNFNHKSGLECTIKSVLCQNCSNFEYIIVDGGSKDGSKEVICNQNLSHNTILKWVSEPDSGTYDAMNKGLKMATGEYVLFLNSGDVFENNHVLKDVMALNLQADLVIGRQLQIRNGKKRMAHRIVASDVNRRYLISNTLPHQATFIRRELLDSLGGYKMEYSIVADWVFWYDAVVNHSATISCVPIVVSTMEEEGMSKDIDQCRVQMAKYLCSQSQSASLEDWKERIEENAQAFQFRSATNTVFGRLLTRLAIYIGKRNSD